MASRKIWDVNQKLTSLINIPGLKILNTVPSKDDYSGVYYPEEPPRCRCGREGQPNGFDDLRTVYHLVDGDIGENEEIKKPKVISIQYMSQRYTCPICYPRGLTGILPYKHNVTAYGSSASEKLSEYIGPLCLDHDPKKVAEALDGLGKDAVKTIFLKWADAKINEYTSRLAAPKKLGLHKVTVAKNQYYFLSDIEDGLLLDIFQDDMPSIIDRLTRLAMLESTSDVLTVVDRLYIAILRGVFRDDAVIRAAAASICHVFATEIYSTVNKNYNGKGKKAIERWLFTPVYEDQAVEPTVNKLKWNIVGPDVWLRWGLIAYEKLRKLIEDRWTKLEFAAWMSNSKWLSPPNGEFAEALSYAQKQIDNSFPITEAQQAYNETEKQAIEILRRNQKCNFEVLRPRLLLSCRPKEGAYRTHDGFRYFYRGISLMKLSTTLKEYDA